MERHFFAVCIYLIGSVFNCYSQTKTIENIKKRIQLSQNNHDRLHALFLLCEQRQSLSSDTLHKYALVAKKLSLQETDIDEQVAADYCVANYLVKDGKLDSALSICDNGLDKLSAKKNNTNLRLKLFALKAQVLVKSNKYKEGLEEFYKTLSLAEQSNDTLMQMIAKNGVGWVHLEMDQNGEALKWFFQAIGTSKNLLHHQKNANIYSNIAAVYIAIHKNDSAEYYLQKAIDFAKKDENLFFLCNSLNILADNYIDLKQPALAEAPLKEAIKIREQIGDPFYIVSDLSQLAIFYAEQSQPQKGIAASLQGIEIARKYNLFSKLPYLQFALAKNYKAAGDYLKYGEILEKVLSLKDSVYQLNSEQALVEIRARYNQQKQENLIMQQKLDINRKNSVLAGASIIVFFGTVISLIVFSNYKRKQKLIVENIKTEEARKAQQAVVAAQENERKRISADLHDNLGAYASAISSNADDLIDANAAVNNAIISNIKSNADDIMNSLRETIWVLNKTEINITSVSDRFKNHVSRILDTYPEFSININENIVQNVALSPETALNMLRIIQEAFHNAIKHSRGDCITVEISSNDRIEISVIDNGEGILNNSNTDGNGISNMQKRANANGWVLKVKKLEPKGTAVELYS